MFKSENKFLKFQKEQNRQWKLKDALNSMTTGTPYQVFVEKNKSDYISYKPTRLNTISEDKCFDTDVKKYLKYDISCITIEISDKEPMCYQIYVREV